MLKELIKFANKLDSLGLTKEADQVDHIVKISGYKFLDTVTESLTSSMGSSPERILKFQIETVLDAILNADYRFGHGGDLSDMPESSKNVLKNYAISMALKNSFKIDDFVLKIRKMYPQIDASADEYVFSRLREDLEEIEEIQRRYNTKFYVKQVPVQNPEQNLKFQINYVLDAILDSDYRVGHGGDLGDMPQSSKTVLKNYALSMALKNLFTIDDFVLKIRKMYPQIDASADEYVFRRLREDLEEIEVIQRRYHSKMSPQQTPVKAPVTTPDYKGVAERMSQKFDSAPETGKPVTSVKPQTKSKPYNPNALFEAAENLPSSSALPEGITSTKFNKPVGFVAPSADKSVAPTYRDAFISKERESFGQTGPAPLPNLAASVRKPFGRD